MTVYDISQEVFSCRCYEGDPRPERREIFSMARGDGYNLSAFSMCAHNGTHVDAPAHFLREGDRVEQLSLSKLIGYAYVCEHQGVLGAADAEAILAQARAIDPEAARRILIKGEVTVSLDAAEVFARESVWLVGNESQSVGPETAPAAVHRCLLGSGTVLLEGIVLSRVPTGVYLLSAAPLLLAGCEGSPCRAVLIAL